MAQGGKRTGAGRKKQERPTDASVAGKVLAKAKAEQTWLALIELEKRRLGISDEGVLIRTSEKDGVITGPDYQGKFSIIPLTNLLRYLEDRAFGRPMENVNHVHDKPVEVNVTHSISERMRLALEKAEKRVSGSR